MANFLNNVKIFGCYEKNIYLCSGFQKKSPSLTIKKETSIMKTAKEIKALESAIYKAQTNYFRAIFTNLKEIGKEVDLINDEIGDVGLTLTNIDDDGNCEVDVVDKVRYNDNGRGESFEVHIIKCDGKECDSWVSIDCFNHDCSMYIFANIKWEK